MVIVWVVAGKKVPTELRYEAEQLKHTADMEDDKSMQLRVCVDWQPNHL